MIYLQRIFYLLTILAISFASASKKDVKDSKSVELVKKNYPINKQLNSNYDNSFMPLFLTSNVKTNEFSNDVLKSLSTNNIPSRSLINNSKSSFFDSNKNNSSKSIERNNQRWAKAGTNFSPALPINLNKMHFDTTGFIPIVPKKKPQIKIKSTTVKPIFNSQTDLNKKEVNLLHKSSAINNRELVKTNKIKNKKINSNRSKMITSASNLNVRDARKALLKMNTLKYLSNLNLQRAGSSLSETYYKLGGQLKAYPISKIRIPADENVHGSYGKRPNIKTTISHDLLKEILHKLTNDQVAFNKLYVMGTHRLKNEQSDKHYQQSGDNHAKNSPNYQQENFYKLNKVEYQNSYEPGYSQEKITDQQKNYDENTDNNQKTEEYNQQENDYSHQEDDYNQLGEYYKYQDDTKNNKPEVSYSTEENNYNQPGVNYNQPEVNYDVKNNNHNNNDNEYNKESNYNKQESNYNNPENNYSNEENYNSQENNYNGQENKYGPDSNHNQNENLYSQPENEYSQPENENNRPNNDYNTESVNPMNYNQNENSQDYNNGGNSYQENNYPSLDGENQQQYGYNLQNYNNKAYIPVYSLQTLANFVHSRFKDASHKKQNGQYQYTENPYLNSPEQFKSMDMNYEQFVPNQINKKTKKCKKHRKQNLEQGESFYANKNVNFDDNYTNYGMPQMKPLVFYGRTS